MSSENTLIFYAMVCWLSSTFGSILAADTVASVILLFAAIQCLRTAAQLDNQYPDTRPAAPERGE